MQNLVGNNASQCPAHQGTTLTRPDELFAWYGKHELQKIKIQIGIALLINRLSGKSDASELPSQNIQGRNVLLEARKSTEERQSSFIAL